MPRVRDVIHSWGTVAFRTYRGMEFIACRFVRAFRMVLRPAGLRMGEVVGLWELHGAGDASVGSYFTASNIM
jgi:hypothetical protein